MHHDIEILPNGNILATVWDRKSYQECIDAGRDSSLLIFNELWPDKIVEIDVDKDSIVWQWEAWDHLVQDYDSAKGNYGVVSDQYRKIDINFDVFNGRPDWMHTNYIDYHPELDQILLCLPSFNEIWIIDHSTTTEEAKGSLGGNYGFGGDLLFRWGNPSTYLVNPSISQQLFFQHGANWNIDFIDQNDSSFGKILIFNNRVGPSESEIIQISPEVDDFGEYKFDAQNGFAPFSTESVYKHEDPIKMWSTIQSNAQLLDNGNTLICSGKQGYLLEVNAVNRVVWEYEIPFFRGTPIEQGGEINSGDNSIFHVRKYPPYFSGFVDKTFNNVGPLESYPNGYECLNTSSNKLLSDDVVEITKIGEEIMWKLDSSIGLVKASVININGQVLNSVILSKGTVAGGVSIKDLPSSLYILLIEADGLSYSHLFYN